MYKLSDVLATLNKTSPNTSNKLITFIAIYQCVLPLIWILLENDNFMVHANCCAVIMKTISTYTYIYTEFAE